MALSDYSQCHMAPEVLVLPVLALYLTMMKGRSLNSSILFFSFCFFSILVRSQSGIEPSKLKQFNITVNFDEYTVKTQMLNQNKSICVNNDRVYMWYNAQKIIETKGGYDGKLIHGIYRAFYLNNQLKEQGQIRYGLRDREWKYWYADGKLKELITWKNGVKNGTYCLYNDYGELMAKGRFRNDKLHGNFYTYGSNGKVADKKKYKRGEEVVPKAKPQKNENTAPSRKEKKERKEKSPKTNKAKEKKPFFKGIFKGKNRTESPAKQKKEEKKKVVTS